jgi:ATP-dependent DNA ligase
VRKRPGVRHRRLHRPAALTIGFGALLLGYYDRGGRLVYAGKVGTGFTNQMLRSLHDRLAAIKRPSSRV